MEDKQERLHLALRKENGQIGYMSKGISIPQFYDLIQPKQQNINVLIDFYPIINKLYSLHNQNQNNEIYIKFNSLYNYWRDAKTHRIESIVLSKSEQLAQQANELLNILKIQLNKNPFNYQDNSYQKLEKTKTFLEYSDMYIETLLCFIHSKASLEIESFQQDTVLSDYIQFLNKIISNFYLKEINYKNNTYDSSLLKYLLLTKSDELKYFLKLHGEKYNLNNFKIYLFNQLQLDSYHYDNNHGQEKEAKLNYIFYDEYEIDIAILLRDTLFKIESIAQLLEKLKEGNTEWSSNNDSIKELESFLEQGDSNG